MLNPGTDLLFPSHDIFSLKDERGEVWKDLVALVENSGQDSIQKMGFILMMARLNNCASCNADSFRAIHGCSVCAKQSLKRFHGSDENLSGLFSSALTEVEIFLRKTGLP